MLILKLDFDLKFTEFYYEEVSFICLIETVKSKNRIDKLLILICLITCEIWRYPSEVKTGFSPSEIKTFISPWRYSINIIPFENIIEHPTMKNKFLSCTSYYTSCYCQHHCKIYVINCITTLILWLSKINRLWSNNGRSSLIHIREFLRCLVTHDLFSYFRNTRVFILYLLFRGRWNTEVFRLDKIQM